MKKMVRALILVIVCVMMTAPGAEIQAKTKKISLVLNGRKQRTVTISNSDKKSKMKIKVSKKSVVKVKRIKKSKKIRFTAKKKGTAKVTVCWKNKKRKKKTSVYLVKVYEKQNKATKKTLTAKENAMRVFRKQNEYRTAAGVEKMEWSDELYDFLIYRMNKSGYDEHKNLNADTRDYFGLYAVYKRLLFAENMLTSGSDSPTEVMRRWTKSKGHKRNYLDANHKCGAIAKVSTMWFAIFWDGDQLVMELSESGKVQKRYIRGNDLVYADKGTDTEKQYYVTDSHGNVVQLTDKSGSVTKTYEYDSVGNEVNPDGKDDNPFRYCGEYYDKETAEIYLRARYYQPEVGRFLTRDTYTGEENEPLSLHLYTYCGNDGVNAWDPSGNISLKGIWNKVKRTTKKVINTGTKVVKKGVRYVANKWRYSTLGKYFARATESGKYSKFMNAFDFYQDSKGIYHTSQNCWQKLGGYNDLYDFFFDAATEIKAIKFNLPTNTRRFNLNKTYVLWAWKGGYFNLGAGGELGIYSNYINIHSLAETKNPIYSKLKVFYKGKKLLNIIQDTYVGG